MVLERRFFMDAKTFLLSVEEGKSILRMEERRKGFWGCAYWYAVYCLGYRWGEGGFAV